MTIAVHQFVPSLAPRDAIGAHTLATQDLLLEIGLRSEIFADEVRPGMEGRARPYRSYRRSRVGGARASELTYLLYQGSIGSPVADFLASRHEPKWVYSHNVTPRRLVEAWDPDVGRAAATGCAQMSRLAPATTATFAASRFNGDQMVKMGFVEPVVVPPLVQLASAGCAADQVTLDRLDSTRRGAELLFVGRLSPHKGQHYLIKALAAYRKAYDPRARLHLVGGAASDLYRDALVRYAAQLDLAEAVNLTGSVTPGELDAHYRSADVFVCASGHEGFCVPLLDAMDHGLPIVAYGAAAVPGTVGGAGLVLDGREPLVLAAAIHRVLADKSLQASMKLAAKSQLSQLGFPAARRAMSLAVRQALAGAYSPGCATTSGVQPGPVVR